MLSGNVDFIERSNLKAAILLPLPESTVAADFNGNDSGEVRDEIFELVQRGFDDCGVTGKIFVAVSTDWAWVQRPRKK
jgi:hypothetical protein